MKMRCVEEISPASFLDFKFKGVSQSYPHPYWQNIRLLGVSALAIEPTQRPCSKEDSGVRKLSHGNTDAHRHTGA